MMSKKISILLFAVLVLSAISCSNNDEGTNVNCSGVTVSFASEVNPLIQTNCSTNASCHGSGSTNGPGPLLTYTQISNNKTSIRTVVRNGTMPKDHTLTAEQKNKIICWVENGGASN